VLLSAPPRRTVDVCVVGAGPVGMSVALEAHRLGLDVLLLEAGGSRSDGVVADLNEGTVTHPPHHAPLSAGTSTGIGGTSWLWGGRCVPFEPVDFGERGHVAGPGWPITHDELRRWYDRAADYLQCGSEFQADDPGWPDLDPVIVRQQERWSRSPQLGWSLGAKVIADEDIAVLSTATVTDLELGQDGSIRAARIRWNGNDHSVAARRFVLACGGLRTTRLLLEVQRRQPSIAGGAGGPLGRYYAGHLNGTIADVRLTSAEDFAHLDLRRDADGTFVRRRLTLAPEIQHDEQLLNIAFYLGNPPFGDARHRSGTLSALFFAMHLPWVGRRIARPETRDHNDEFGWANSCQHLLNIVRQPLVTVAGLGRILWRRLFSTPRLHVFVACNPSGVYALRFHAEQTCRPENRITLSQHRSPDGQVGVDVALEYSAQDIDSVLRAHALLDERLRASGRGELIYHDDTADRFASVRDQAVDGYHQVGSTRMSADPADGVVDTDGKVHGLTNLYVASSSVFPTAGEANPTFTAVCLGVRLAHHLAAVKNGSDSRPEAA
jgi:choline dehydrogenase-like flavoprotein